MVRRCSTISIATKQIPDDVIAEGQIHHGRSEQIGKSAKSGSSVCLLRSRRGTLQSAASSAAPLAKLEAAASLEIAQVAGQKSAKPRHWRDVAKTVSQIAEDHRGTAAVVGTT